MTTSAVGDRRAPWILLAIIALGAGLRLFQLGAEPLWQDEAFSWRWAHLPLARIWGDAAPHEYSPPLFFSLQRLWLAFGDDEFTLRLLPALFGLLTIPLVFAVGRATVGSTVGLVAAALTATSAPLIAYSQEYRTYAFLCCVGSLAAFGLVLFLRSWTAPERWPRAGTIGVSTTGQRRLGLGLYVVGTILALYAHNTAVFLPVIANLVALSWWLGFTRRSREFAVWWIGANLVPFLLWLWWVPVMLAQAADPEARFSYRRPSAPFALMRTFALYCQQYLPVAKPLQLLVPIPALAVLGVWAWRHRPAPLLVPLAIAAGIPLLTFAMSWLIRPIWDQRVLIWSLPMGLVLVAAGIVAIRRNWLRMVVGGLVGAAQLANLAAFYALPQKDAWSALVNEIAAQHRQGDAFVLYPFTTHDSFAYYARRDGLPENDFILLRRAPPNGYPSVDVQRNVRPVIGPEDLQELAATSRRLWIVMRDSESHDPEGSLAATIESLGVVADRRSYAQSLRLFLVDTPDSAGQATSPVGTNQ